MKPESPFKINQIIAFPETRLFGKNGLLIQWLQIEALKGKVVLWATPGGNFVVLTEQKYRELLSKIK